MEPWLEPLPGSAQMRAADAAAIEAGTPGLELMERAAAGLALAVHASAPHGTVVVLCGKGNNGGDGYAAARLLRRRGRDVRVIATAPVEELRGDARTNAEAYDGDVEAWPAPLDGAAIVVDCLLGTGFSGAPHGPIAEAIAAVRAFDGPVAACDVPSGVDASTGEVHAEAVEADLTVTFAAAKPGLWIHPGKAYAGRVEVLDIGVTPETRAGLLRREAVAALRRRGRDATKFSSGHVTVCGASVGMTGAVRLASSAAMRAGAGYVTACVPPELLEVVDLAVTEAVTKRRDEVLGATERGGALVLGCGIGRADDTMAFVRDTAAGAGVPLVLDADGLFAFNDDLEALRARPAPTVLTPHAGELGRLLGVESGAIGARRLHHARDAAERAAAVVVLKGDDTLVVAPDGRLAVSPGDAPGLATAGTGDVLAGTTGAALAAGLEPFHAACAAVMAHLLAGRLAAAPHGPDGVIASDVVARLPAAIGG